MESTKTRSEATQRTRSVVFVGLTIAIMAVSAWVVVPLGPIPFTLQMFAITFAIVVLSPKEAIAAITGYLLLGAVGLLRLETLAGRLLNAGPGRCGRMVLAVTLHNLPEGMVVGLAAALALRGEPDAISGALALALGIGLQNIPEGAAVSLPLAQEGRSKCRAFAAGAASGLVEPLGGLLALALAGWVSAALPWLMSLAAGCMVCVTAQEMIPEAVEADEPAGVISVVAGFALMMALDVAL